MRERETSTRSRVFYLVKAYAWRTGTSPARVWEKLYQAFEVKSNRPWLKMAYNENRQVLDLVQDMKSMEALLECARELFSAQAPTPVRA